MAIQLYKENDKYNVYHQHFYIDNISDLDSIETEYKCQMGDIAELPDGTQYRRHSDNYSGQMWDYFKGGGSSGGGDLPDVTAADNGDFLSVQNGEWSKVSGYKIENSAETIIALQNVTTTSSPIGAIGQVVGTLDGVISEGDEVVVTFDGIEYTPPITFNDNFIILGDLNGEQPSFENYPFCINAIVGEGDESGIMLITEDAGTHALKIGKGTQTIIPSDTFKTAVNEANKINNAKVYIPKQTVEQTINSNAGVPLVLASGMSSQDIIDNGESITVIVNDKQLEWTWDGSDHYWVYSTNEQTYWVGINYIDDDYKLVFMGWDEVNDCPLVGNFIVEGFEEIQFISGIPTIWFYYESPNWTAKVNNEQAFMKAVENNTPVQAFAIEDGMQMPANAIVFTNNGPMCYFYTFDSSRQDYFKINKLILGIQDGQVIEETYGIQLEYHEGLA